MKNLLKWLYARYVNELFLPEKTEAFVTITDGEIDSLRLTSLRPYREKYLFAFNNKLGLLLVRSNLSKKVYTEA